jgi:catechol 2,3-dioxygenase-like lactoylglutathione lyase family enzyme
MPKFRKLVPMLHTKDMDRTVAWYETVLGFEHTGPKADGWCCLSRDGVSIMFMNNANLGEPTQRQPSISPSMTLMRCGTEIRAHCQAEWGPEDFSYGLREFAIKDPNGYLLSFGSPIGTQPQSNKGNAAL